MEQRAFIARLRQRKIRWWTEEHPGVHGPSACHALLHWDDPDERWKCCPFWQRKLSNKWNGREFARRCGARVPELYWSGRDVEAVPFETLPRHYVVRSTSGSRAKNVLLMAGEKNLLDERTYTREQVNRYRLKTVA